MAQRDWLLVPHVVNKSEHTKINFYNSDFLLIVGIIGKFIHNLLIVFTSGVVRSMHCNPDFPADIVPVDVCMNAIITAAWERGLKHENKDIEFRNIVSLIFVLLNVNNDLFEYQC